MLQPGLPPSRSRKREGTMEEEEQRQPEPKGGAGLYDVDPPQDGITQDPEIIPVSDVDALPEGVEL
jgi:hypothetical protein